jgi:dimethylamine monooxygenase subunit C
MLISGIKSRPQYPGLKPIPSAKRHLIAAQGAGIEPVLSLFDRGQPDFAGKAEIFYTGPDHSAEGFDQKLRQLGVSSVQTYQDEAGLFSALDAVLAKATMGARLYAAGTEGFVGRVIKLGVEHGIDHRSIITEHRGSLARRVQCVHCKGFTENVTTSIFECSHCANLLLVRDHYSRRLAAFQGVCANAEDPSTRPQAEEIYL